MLIFNISEPTSHKTINGCIDFVYIRFVHLWLGLDG
jgi:hypothetical protein